MQQVLFGVLFKGLCTGALRLSLPVCLVFFGILVPDAVAADFDSRGDSHKSESDESEPRIERTGTSLTITWQDTSAGAWQLRDDNGLTCASGAIAPGENRLHFPKTAIPANLRLVLAREGQPDRMYPIAGTQTISQLKKPSNATVIYQVPVRTHFARNSDFNSTGKLSDLTDSRLAEIKALGNEYIWLTGVLEHSTVANMDPDVVKGDAGSYYAITDNWDVSQQIGTIIDFKMAVARAHAAGLRVIIDFVANHTARVHRTDVTCKEQMDFGRSDYKNQFFYQGNNYYYVQNSTFSPPPRNGTPGVDGIFDTDIFSAGLQYETPAKVTGNDIRSASPDISDWFETVKLNYGFDIDSRKGFYNPRPRTWDQMVDVAKYWMMHGVDGFRVDFAHAVPMEFWRHFANELKRLNPEVFLLAEAYEKDERMKIPGFSYQAMLSAGFDSVYNSEQYWSLRQQAIHPGDMRAANPAWTPAHDEANQAKGYLFTHYMENHDEIRLAARVFSPWVGDRAQRANLGLTYAAYSALLPGHFLMHGGQEVGEDASVFGHYAGDNGRTSIFDFVYQPYTRHWLYEQRPGWMVAFRDRYEKLLTLKNRSPFNLPHSRSKPSYIDLDGANWTKDQSKWIGAYIRYSSDRSGNQNGKGNAWLVVTNSDPFAGHVATLHFTPVDGQDRLGALAALGIKNDSTRYFFKEVFSREGWVPRDPGVDGEGLPGWVMFRAGDVPSGLHLGEIPAATTFVFELATQR